MCSVPLPQCTEANSLMLMLLNYIPTNKHDMAHDTIHERFGFTIFVDILE